MRNKQSIIQIATLVAFLSACGNADKSYDATGSFEAIERTISAEATGKIKTLDIVEGQLLKSGDVIGSIDVSNLAMQEEQLQSSITAIGKKTNDPTTQLLVIQQQISNTEKDIERFKKLVQANAAPQKQLDDLYARKLVLKTQYNATKSSINNQNRAILSEVAPNEKRLALIQKQIKDGIIVNAHDGTVTTQLAYDGEFTSIGRPLYRIADLSEITLRVYVSGNQLPLIKLNQEVTVHTDDGTGGFKETTGSISWISSKAEFTPKTIQTKDERANLVYAIKVMLPNDGSYKIGMYGEVKF
ncbi:MAG: HlyD family secretion protein [Marivirga sp.]|jgi:HlyD family secretion protein